MESTEKSYTTEEPMPGWIRIEVEGSKPWYKTPIPRTVIRNKRMLMDYLAREHKHDRLLEVDGSEFSFKRRYGLRAQQQPLDNDECVFERLDCDISGSGDNLPVNKVGESNLNGAVKQLVKVKTDLDHRKMLSQCAKKIDSARLHDSYKTPPDFTTLKEKIFSSPDLKAMLCEVNNDRELVEALDLMFADNCLAEISLIDTKSGPLVDFPVSVNSNIYCDIAEYGMENCPRLFNLIINMVVRRGDPVLPSHVLQTSTLFSTICYAANHNLDAMTKLRSLSLQCDGLSNVGLDLMSDTGLAQCARSMSNHRDILAEIGPIVMNTTASNCPYQSTLDNCDIQSEHLTIETVEKELIDTTDLSTDKCSKEEALEMFCKEQVLLGLNQHEEERNHLLEVIAIEVIRILCERRPEAKKLEKFLPRHHQHSNSNKEMKPAVVFIKKPYALQETKNPDTIKLLIRIQRQHLRYVSNLSEPYN